MQGGYAGSAPSSIRPTGQGSPGSQLFQALRQSGLHRNRKVLGVGFLWLFGLFAVFLSPAPVRITEQKLDEYEKRLKILADTTVPMQKAEQQYIEAEMEVQAAKEWFWRFKPAVRERVNKKKAKSAEVWKKYAELDRKAQRKFSDAKAELGLWSEAGVGEGRDLFWKAFERGKVFGRRQTFWDALITLMTSREEGILGMVVQLIFQTMINFTTGMVASTFIFIFSLPSFLWSYQPSFVSGMAFFVIAAIGALSVISSFLLALFGAGATAVYSIATLSPNMRIGARPRRRAANIRYHYD